MGAGVKKRGPKLSAERLSDSAAEGQVSDDDMVSAMVDQLDLSIERSLAVRFVEEFLELVRMFVDSSAKSPPQKSERPRSYNPLIGCEHFSRSSITCPPETIRSEFLFAWRTTLDRMGQHSPR